MMDLTIRLWELARSGFECSQMIAILVLETLDEDSPDLIRAMSGLTGGMGHTGGVCGCQTSGCCVLGYFSGSGEAEEVAHSRSEEAICEYCDWFTEWVGKEDKSTVCNDILHGDFSQCMKICMPMIEACYRKIMEIIEEYGFA